MQTNVATNILLIKSVRFPRRNIFYTPYHTYQLQELFILLIPYSCTFQFGKKLCTPLLITRQGKGGKTALSDTLPTWNLIIIYTAAINIY